jgi:DNA-binding SARP family transcriptional activator/tetratricopeptide (TPR) repeat protein
MRVDFALLGGVEARIDEVPVDLGHARQRCVLAALLVDVNRTVPADQLLDRVWAQRMPHRARNVLSGYLSRLRQVLAPADVRISRQPGGYVLSADPATVDLHHFRGLVGEARQAGTDADVAAALLNEALGLWRGAAFGTLDTPWLNSVRDVLDAERYAAELDRNDVVLRMGRPAGVLGDIATSVERFPLDERLAGQLMLALFQSGRQADSLAAFRAVQRRLVDELGADPGPALQQLQQRILDGDPGLLAPTTGEPSKAAPAGRAVPRQLPAAPKMFAGRRRELADLDECLREADEQSNTVIISTVSGTGGIGKTALALHWAHRVADRFPDGQLYINLRGFDPSGSAVTATEAIRGFLEALGVPAPRLPAGLDAQVGLYRSLLAGCRMLVVLDNARDVEQIRPLIPGAAGCFTLVTSRNLLTGLVVAEGAVPLGLDILDHGEAHALLEQRLGSERLDSEPHATEAIIACCGRLPLALAIVAARAASRRGLPLRTLADQLRDVRDRLDAFDIGGTVTDVRAVFSWSYAALGSEEARAFRLLGLHPGPDVSAAATASLIGRSERLARTTLTRLTAANLVSEPEPGRYTFHDLLRAYAAELAETHDPADQRCAAQQRMLDHYLHAADTADRLIYPHRDPLTLPPPRPDVVEERLTDARQALRWFSREERALLTMTHIARALGRDTYAGQLAWTMVNFLDRQGLWPDWVEVQATALHAAGTASDLRGQAVAHRGLEHCYLQIGRYDDAQAHGRCALELFRGLADDAGAAQTNLALGVGAARQGDNATALACFLEAHALYGAIGHRAGLANALNNAAWAHSMLGDFDRTVALCEEAVMIQKEIGDRYALGSTWDTLGYAHHHLGNHQQAISCYRNALELIREQGDRYLEAETLAHLGDVREAAGDVDGARAAWRSALDIYLQLSHPDAAEMRAKLNI